MISSTANPTRTSHGIGTSAPALTWHSLQRWQERVEPGSTTSEARQGLGEFVAHSHLRSTQRHWTDVEPTPGLAFLYWSVRPDVCGLVLGGVVVTVLARRRERTALRDLRIPSHNVGTAHERMESLGWHLIGSSAEGLD